MNALNPKFCADASLTTVPSSVLGVEEFARSPSETSVRNLAMRQECTDDLDCHPPKRPNPVKPKHMTAPERRAEICSLLAQGVIRLHQRDAAKPSEKSLHVTAEQSVHATPTRKEVA